MRRDFPIIPIDALPERKGKAAGRGKYTIGVETFLNGPHDVGRVGGENPKTAYHGYHRIIKRDYANRVALQQIDGELYIVKL
jgi:hypothetical protein